MKLLRWAGWAMVVAAIGASGVAVGGCSDDENGASDNDGSKSDSGVTSSPDSTASNPDSSTPGKDGSTTEDSGDAGPGVTKVLGALGEVQVFSFMATAHFYQDNTNVHAVDSPNCFASTRSEGKHTSGVNKVTLGGDFVADAGLSEAPEFTVSISDVSGDYYYDYAPEGLTIYSVPGGGKVIVQIEGTDALAVPDVPPATLQGPVLGDMEVSVTEPVPTGDPPAPVTAHLSKGMTFKWDKTDVGSTVSQRVNVVFRNFHEFDPETNPLATRSGELYCSFPLSDGQGFVPPSLLQEVADDVGAKSLAASVEVTFGDSKEVVVGTSSFFLMTQAFTNASVPYDVKFEP